MKTQEVLLKKAESVFYKIKSSPVGIGGIEQCLVCGEMADWITNAHATSHGYKNRREMADSGKIMSRATGKVKKCLSRV